jgi:DNA polymerase-3 subunit delta'
VRRPAPAVAIAWLHDAGVRDAENWLALAGGSPLLALELNVSGERVLLDSLLAQVSRAEGLDPLAGGGDLDKVVKADKRPAPLKRAFDWAQKWLFDLTLASEGLAPRYFLAQAAAAATPGARHRHPQALGIQSKSDTIQGPVRATLE